MAYATLQRPEGAAEDWTIPQDWDRYSPAEHALWYELFERQAGMLSTRVVPEFMVYTQGSQDHARRVGGLRRPR